MAVRKTRKADKAKSAEQLPAPSGPSSLVPALILAAVFILFSIIRIRLASCPLERDEG